MAACAREDVYWSEHDAMPRRRVGQFGDMPNLMERVLREAAGELLLPERLCGAEPLMVEVRPGSDHEDVGLTVLPTSNLERAGQ